MRVELTRRETEERRTGAKGNGGRGKGGGIQELIRRGAWWLAKLIILFRKMNGHRGIQ